MPRRTHINQRTNHQKHRFLLTIAAMVASLGSSALAQDTDSAIVEKHGSMMTQTEFQPAGTTNLNVQMLKDFSSVKQNDPDVAPQLAGNPSLAGKPGFSAEASFPDSFPRQVPRCAT